MSSNLPPGCTSPDGGIDPQMEAALETLCDAVETVSGAELLTHLAPLVERGLAAEYGLGFGEGQMCGERKAEEIAADAGRENG